MTFDEDFPSLKGTQRHCCEAVDTDDVTEHCLDKQRVREVIRKLKNAEEESDWFTLERLTAELGL